MGVLAKRDIIYDDSDDRYVSFWYTKTGYIVRWVIFVVFVLIIVGWVVGGYYHAKLRLRKGLPPLAYHRCLVARRAYAPPTQTYNPTTGYYGADSYNMGSMPPPPVYDGQRPPEYAAPPEGATKIDPSQWRAEPTYRQQESSSAAQGTGDFEAPPGPPPNHPASAVTRP